LTLEFGNMQMCKPLKTADLFSFSATAPQLDSFTQQVNEFELLKITSHMNFIDDLQSCDVSNCGI
jgi:hypothetical protein